MANQTYLEIPAEVRELLDQVYDDQGAVIWWQTPQPRFGDWSAKARWLNAATHPDHHDRDEILAALHRLIDGAYE